jgi:hypothetical protein
MMYASASTTLAQSAMNLLLWEGTGFMSVGDGRTVGVQERSGA